MTTQPSVISAIAKSIGLDYAIFMAFIMTESSGQGFDPATGKIIIRFEASWFLRKLDLFHIPYQATPIYTDGTKTKIASYIITAAEITFTTSTKDQAANWASFNNAWKISHTCAMLSTSWGAMQVMGFNYAACGFKTVDDMVTAMHTEVGQITAAASFIQHTPSLLNALKARNYQRSAYFYNGENYRENNYDVTLQKWDNYYSKQNVA